MTFWESLPRPFSVLAPLEGVADTVFRQIVASCAKPDLFFTEFTSAEGFCSSGKDIVSQNLTFSPGETPIIAQLWGSDPTSMEIAAREVSHMGFAGIDINMGCPDKSVIAHKSGAALIEDPPLAAALIAAAKRGAEGRIPISVKTRIGYNKIQTDAWVSFLLSQDIAALSIHGRTKKELSKVPAHWDEIEKAVAVRNRMGVSTVIIGNGDIADWKDIQQKAAAYGVDGGMIGRGIFSNLWAFDTSETPHRASTAELLDCMERHIRLFTNTWQEAKHYAILKKFYKIYVNGFYGATDWRVKFMETTTAAEALTLLSSLRTHLALPIIRVEKFE